MIEFTVGILVAISIYLILENSNYRKIFGLALLGTTINLILLLSGKITNSQPAFIGSAPTHTLSNPLPQALILTAFVIGFGLLVILCALFKVVIERQT